MRTETWYNDINRRERSIWRKTCRKAISPTTNPIRNSLGSNLGIFHITLHSSLMYFLRNYLVVRPKRYGSIMAHGNSYVFLFHGGSNSRTPYLRLLVSKGCSSLSRLWLRCFLLLSDVQRKFCYHVFLLRPSQFIISRLWIGISVFK